MSDSKLLVGIDCGFGQVKAVASNGKSIVFPSLVSQFGTDTFGDDIEHAFEDYDGRKYLVGDEARERGRPVATNVDSSWMEKTHYRILFQHALNRLDARECRLITGLPVEYHTKGNRLKSIIASWHERGGFDIEVAGVLPQPVGTIMSIAAQEDGQIAHAYQSKVGIVDIGNGTVDCIEVNEMKVNHLLRNTKARAVSSIFDSICDHVQSRHGVGIDHADAATILRTGSFTYKGKPIDMTNKLATFRKGLCDAVVKQVNDLWGSRVDLLTKIVFTGGGAALLREEIGKAFPKEQVVIPDDPVMANAQGYLRFLGMTA